MLRPLPTPSSTPRASGHPLHRAPTAHAAALVALFVLAGCARPAGPVPARSAPPPTTLQFPTTRADPDAREALEADPALGFAAWRTAFMAQALQAGIRPDTVREVLGNARWQPRVVALDRAQPEFTRSPWAYLDSAVSPQRVAQGQARQAEHAAPLQAASARYGVPAAVITAIWGMESDYGRHFGDFRTVDALATLASEGRRRAWAQKELLAALRIIDAGDIAPERMVGSWAGAMGHTQFLPSVFLAYAVDADGDGHRDIWGSVADVLASTAAFLASEGWRQGEAWGAEVTLPRHFDYARAELTVRQSSAQWAAEGVGAMGAMGASSLPVLDSASILTPAGARGPAFLVGHNFRTLLRYNNAVTYALGVAQLAQQIEGGPAIAGAWPRDLRPLSREQVQTLQAALNARGFDAGTPDGRLGPATRAGLRRYQQSEGLAADGYATLELLERLQGKAPPATTTLPATPLR